MNGIMYISFLRYFLIQFNGQKKNTIPDGNKKNNKILVELCWTTLKNEALDNKEEKKKNNNRE